MHTPGADHPIVDRARSIGPLVANGAAQADLDRRLDPSVVEAIGTAGLFQMYRPGFLDGPDIEPLDALAACEELGRHDGSAAWCVQVSNAVMPMLGSIDPDAAAEMVAQVDDLRLAGSARPLGTARAIPGGYVLSGRWNFVSNVNHADWVMASAFLADDESAGRRRVISAYVPVSKLTIVPTWDVVGMRGTGSDDAVIEEVYVPAEMTASGRHLKARTERRFHPRAAMTVTWAPVTGVSLGIARGAIDDFAAIANLSSTASPVPLRERPETQAAIGEADMIVRAARALAVDAIGTVWNEAAEPGGVSDLTVARSLMAMSHAIRECARAVDLVFHAAGTNAISTGHTLERRFRNAHAAVQHASASKHQIQHGGRVVLGLSADHHYFA